MNNDNTYTLVESLRVERIAQRLTQRQLAEKTGIKQQYIGRIENHQITPTITTVLKITEALGLELCLKTTSH